MITYENVSKLLDLSNIKVFVVIVLVIIIVLERQANRRKYPAADLIGVVVATPCKRQFFNNELAVEKCR